MSPEGTADTLVRGKFAIDCIEIEAVQEESNQPLIYKGPGNVFSKENGSINCKFYAQNNKQEPLSELFGSINALSGALYSPSDYFTLTATAMDGHKWIARKVIINTERSLNFPASPSYSPGLG